MKALKKVIEGVEKTVDFHPIDVKDALADGWVPVEDELPTAEPAPEKNSGTPPYIKPKNKGSNKDEGPGESISGT